MAISAALRADTRAHGECHITPSNIRGDAPRDTEGDVVRQMSYLQDELSASRQQTADLQKHMPVITTQFATLQTALAGPRQLEQWC